MTNPYEQRNALMQAAYGEEQSMQLRKKLHDEHTTPAINMPTWVSERFVWTGNEQILDLGSGSGAYRETVTQYVDPQNYVGGDLSYGMLSALQRQAEGSTVKLAQLDAEALPFADNRFDVVLANHVLHHMVDLDTAIREIRRVLKPATGVLIASTNSEFTMPEFNTLMQRAVRLLRQSPVQEMRDASIWEVFSLESGSVTLARHFQSIARYDIPSAFVFREIQPAIDFLDSSRPFYEPQLPEGIVWDDFMTIMKDQIRRLIDHFGELVVNKLSGVIIATDEGGFASEYQRLRAKTTP